MQLLFDLHTHTTASGHGFSTLKENIEEAGNKGLKAMGTSDHSSAMPGSAAPIFFTNYRAVPREIMGVRIFTGVEANIMDMDGNLDMDEQALGKMDYVIASFHVPCVRPGTRQENTRALIEAMSNPFVKIIGHPDDDRFPLEYERLVEAAAREQVALEVNSSSVSERTGRANADKNIPLMLSLCKTYRVPVVVGSDAHICFDVGNFENACFMLEKCGFPQELVLNTRMENLDFVMNR